MPKIVARWNCLMETRNSYALSLFISPSHLYKHTHTHTPYIILFLFWSFYLCAETSSPFWVYIILIMTFNLLRCITQIFNVYRSLFLMCVSLRLCRSKPCLPLIFIEILSSFVVLPVFSFLDLIFCLRRFKNWSVNAIYYGFVRFPNRIHTYTYIERCERARAINIYHIHLGTGIEI